MASEESTETADALEAVLAAFKAGSIDGDEAARQIRGHFFTDLGHTVLDTDRAQLQSGRRFSFGHRPAVDDVPHLASFLIFV